MTSNSSTSSARRPLLALFAAVAVLGIAVGAVLLTRDSSDETEAGDEGSDPSEEPADDTTDPADEPADDSADPAEDPAGGGADRAEELLGMPNGLPAPGFVGHTVTEAEQLAAEQGWTVRVVAEDGERFMVTQDYDTERVNLVVESGTVTAAARG